jgi:hypothetical protein
MLRVGQGTPLALALDATLWGTHCTVLAISVVERGGAIPLAWPVLLTTAQQAWRREWWRMLCQVRRAVPAPWPVLVLADRGLDARGLLRRLTRLGWHPLLRSNTGGTLRPQGQWCRRRAPAGRARASRSKAATASSTACGWRAGRRVTRPPGCS